MLYGYWRFLHPILNFDSEFTMSKAESSESNTVLDRNNGSVTIAYLPAGGILNKDSDNFGY